MRIILFLALATAAYLIYKIYLQKLLQQGTAGRVKIGLIVVGFLFLFMAATGKASVVFGIIGAAMTQAMRIVPLLVRFAPFLSKYLGPGVGLGGLGAGLGSAGSHAGSTSESTVKTKSLIMSLNHASGKIDGRITAGKFDGAMLSQLSLEQLQAYYHDCETNDPEAIRVLQAYIARERPEWADAPNDENSSSAQVGDGQLSAREAYDILGLDEGCTKEDIVNAHRSLMRQFHPDKGGSNYFAAKLNEAKSVLLASTLDA